MRWIRISLKKQNTARKLFHSPQFKMLLPRLFLRTCTWCFRRQSLILICTLEASDWPCLQLPVGEWPGWGAASQSIVSFPKFFDVLSNSSCIPCTFVIFPLRRQPLVFICTLEATSATPSGPVSRLRSSEKLRWQVGALSAFHQPPFFDVLSNSSYVWTLNLLTESSCVAFTCLFGIRIFSTELSKPYGSTKHNSGLA